MPFLRSWYYIYSSCKVYIIDVQNSDKIIVNTLDPNFFVRVNTILECNNTCTITIYTSGEVQLIKNHRSTLLSASMGSTLLNVTVNRVLSGVNRLTLYLTGSSAIALYVEGANSAFYGHKYNQGVETITGMAGDTSLPANCNNGIGNISF